MKDELLERLAPHGQQHLLTFWNELDEAGRQRLAEQIRGIDFGRIARLYAQRDEMADYRALADRAGPPPGIRLDGSGAPFSREQAVRRGEEALRAGRIGAILVAGGQGSRLGFDRPRGCFPSDPSPGVRCFRFTSRRFWPGPAATACRSPFT